jgi:hypothetical protein
MTARRIREWPRVAAAALVLAALLVAIGFLAASGGGSSSGAATVRLRRLAAGQTAALRRADRALADLRAQLAATASELSTSRAELAVARDRARCWRQVALHHRGRSPKNCGQVT